MLKTQLFSPEACVPGTYKSKTHDFCLQNEHSDENLYQGIRESALDYFQSRGIGWHDGLFDVTGANYPSNHLCCSQSFCVNSLFPFISGPKRLKEILCSLGYAVKEVLPFDLDLPLGNGSLPFVAFEWIGLENYLRETNFGRVMADKERNRGKGTTSADFAIRFRRQDGSFQMVLGEWKYTESYDAKSIRFSRAGTDRLEIYGPALAAAGCHIKLPSGIKPDALFYDPFDQMMRLQLLAHAMECKKEMDADVVSVLHVGPKANAELMNKITSPKLAGLGRRIHEVWSGLIADGKFKAVCTEDFLRSVLDATSDADWKRYMQIRYDFTSSPTAIGGLHG